MIDSIIISPLLTKYSSHKHSQYELVLAVSGHIDVKVDDATHHMTEGDLLIIPPGVAHEGTSGENYRDIFIKTNYLPFSEPLMVHDYDGSILILFQLINRLISEKESNYLSITDNLLSAVIEFVRKYTEVNYRFPFVAEVKKKIFKNLHNSAFSISDEVRSMGYNTDYFRRCFRRDVGCNPLEYITRLRIEKAQSLLREPRYRGIEDIAEQCGFNDCFYFSRTFKQYLGISPREYRKRFIEQ